MKSVNLEIRKVHYLNDFLFRNETKVYFDVMEGVQPEEILAIKNFIRDILYDN